MYNKYTYNVSKDTYVNLNIAEYFEAIGPDRVDINAICDKINSDFIKSLEEKEKEKEPVRFNRFHKYKK